MGCQKNIAKTICEQGADYLLGLKGNHPTLHHELLDAFDEETCAHLAKSTNTFHTEADKGHGRLELRKVWVQHDVDWLYQSDQWMGLKTLVLVESERNMLGLRRLAESPLSPSLHIVVAHQLLDAFFAHLPALVSEVSQHAWAA